MAVTRVGVVVACLVGLAACGEEAPGACAPLGDPSIELGVGTQETGFSPFNEGDTLGLELGPQGLHMYVTGLRVTGLSGGESQEGGTTPTVNTWTEVLVDDAFLANLEMLLDKPEDRPHALTPEVVESMQAKEGDFVSSAGWYGHPRFTTMDDGRMELLGIRLIADLDAQYLYDMKSRLITEVEDPCGRMALTVSACTSVWAAATPGACGPNKECCFDEGATPPPGFCDDVLAEAEQ